MPISITFDGPTIGCHSHRLLHVPTLITQSDKNLNRIMFEFIELIERDCGQEFIWKFQRHAEVYYGDEDSENVYSIGPVYWFVQIKDSGNQVIHRNWAIAVSEDWGDILAARVDYNNDEYSVRTLAARLNTSLFVNALSALAYSARLLSMKKEGYSRSEFRRILRYRRKFYR
jgi:hypothetical protein